MTFLYPFILIGLLGVIIYQDFRYRALSLFVVIGALLLVVINSVIVNGWKQALVYAGMNVLLLTIQMLGVTAYFSIKHKAFTNIINTYLGSGDLWFYGVLACSFSPLNFVLFNLVACLIILIVYAMAGFRIGQPRTIPFAGCLALAMAMVVVASYVFHGVRVYDDWYLMWRMFGG